MSFGIIPQYPTETFSGYVGPKKKKKVVKTFTEDSGEQFHGKVFSSTIMIKEKKKTKTTNNVYHELSENMHIQCNAKENGGTKGHGQTFSSKILTKI